MAQLLERIDGNAFGRVYHIPDTKFYFPSVTTILAKKSNPKLDKLRLDMGIENFERRRNFAGRRGTVMHKWLEIFLVNLTNGCTPEYALELAQDEAPKEFPGWENTNKKELKIGRDLFYNFYHAGHWRRVNKLVFSELFLHTTFRGGWAGAADFAFKDDSGDLILWDFKSASEERIEEDVESYYMQVAAYMFMYAQMHGEMPVRGEIIMMNEKSDTVQMFHLPKSEVKMHLDKFLECLKLFEDDKDWQEFKTIHMS